MTSSARRALRVLEVVIAADAPLGVTAIAEAVGTTPGTAFRSLDALARGEFISRYRASTQYEIGPAAKRLKHTLYAQFPLRKLATPFLRRLAFATSDTVSLTVPVGWFGLRLVVVAGSRSIRSGAGPGICGPLDETFVGRAILSTFEPELLGRFLAEAPPPAHGPRQSRTLSKTLRLITQSGFSLEPLDGPGGQAIAFPVRKGGRAIAAVAIDGPIVGEGGPEPAALAEWLGIIGEMEAMAAGEAVEGPFAHLDPGAATRALLPPAPIVAEDEED